MSISEEDARRIWNQDAPDGTCWRCPDCKSWSKLGGNAVIHARGRQHGAPDLAPIPEEPKTLTPSAMLSEACAALGIEPGGDEAQRWADVLEAIRLLMLGGLSLYNYQKLEGWAADPNRRDPNTAFTAGAARDAANAVAGALAERVAVDVLGWAIVDKNGKAHGLRPANATYIAHLWVFEDEKAATTSCGWYNEMRGDDYESRQPFRVAPVGPVQEMKTYGWGVAGSDGYTAPRHDSIERIAAERAARSLSQPTVARASGVAVSAPFRAVELFYFISPPDRPAEAAEPAPAETESALLEGRAEDWSVAPGGGEGETGQPRRGHRVAFSGSGAQVRCWDCGMTLLGEEVRGECTGPRLFWGSEVAE